MCLLVKCTFISYIRLKSLEHTEHLKEGALQSSLLCAFKLFLFL